MGKLITLLAILVLLIGVCYGWVMNIVHLATDATMTTGLLIGRILGIFLVPVGGILGFI